MIFKLNKKMDLKFIVDYNIVIDDTIIVYNTQRLDEDNYIIEYKYNLYDSDNLKCSMDDDNYFNEVKRDDRINFK